jgi:hypothetical protein
MEDSSMKQDDWIHLVICNGRIPFQHLSMRSNVNCQRWRWHVAAAAWSSAFSFIHLSMSKINVRMRHQTQLGFHPMLVTFESYVTLVLYEQSAMRWNDAEPAWCKFVARVNTASGLQVEKCMENSHCTLWSSYFDCTDWFAQHIEIKALFCCSLISNPHLSIYDDSHARIISCTCC